MKSIFNPINSQTVIGLNAPYKGAFNPITIIFKPMKQNHQLSADVKLKVIAINKITFKEHETFMTYHEWINLNKSSKFYYKAIAR
jgi:hypothetical protein